MNGKADDQLAAIVDKAALSRNSVANLDEVRAVRCRSQTTTGPRSDRASSRGREFELVGQTWSWPLSTAGFMRCSSDSAIDRRARRWRGPADVGAIHRARTLKKKFANVPRRSRKSDRWAREHP